MFQRLFARYSGWLRHLKGAYMLNNLFNVPRLQHNRALYRKYGVQKSIFAPLSERDFPNNTSEEGPWLDQPDALERLATDPVFQTMSPTMQAKVRGFVEEGYMVLEQLIPSDTIAALNAETERLLEQGKAGFNFTGRKIFNLFEHSALANEQFFRRKELLDMLSFLLGRELIPFQSLNFVLGSEQRAHSDLIHMTTEPRGYMIAAWIALEPCTPDNGPVVYYPGSHRLPFIGTKDYDSGNTFFTLGQESNKKYEDRIEALIEEKGLKKAFFLAQTGDVLIWHANLIHGGSKILSRDAGVTRRSMVCHYFAEGVICYHELLQRPALLPLR